jgi:hypothetical protein
MQKLIGMESRRLSFRKCQIRVFSIAMLKIPILN